MNIHVTNVVGNDTNLSQQTLLAELHSQLEKNEVKWSTEDYFKTEIESTDSTKLELSEIQSTISKNSIIVIPKIISQESAHILETVRSVLPTVSEESIFVHIKVSVAILRRFLETHKTGQQEHDIKKFVSLCYLIYTLWITNNKLETGVMGVCNNQIDCLQSPVSSYIIEKNEKNKANKTKKLLDQYEVLRNSDSEMNSTDEKSLCSEQKTNNNDLYFELPFYDSLIECLHLSSTIYNDNLIEDNTFSALPSLIVLGILCLIRSVEFCHAESPLVQRTPRKLCLEKLFVCIAIPNKVLAAEIVNTLERFYCMYQDHPGYVELYIQCIIQIMNKQNTWFSVKKNNSSNFEGNDSILSDGAVVKRKSKRKTESTAYHQFFNLIERIAHFFPFEFRCKLFVDQLFNSILQTSRLTIMNRETYAMQTAILKLTATYFENVSSNNQVNKTKISSSLDSLWNTQCKIVTALLFQQTTMQHLNSEKHAVHVKAIFNGLISLIHIMIENSAELKNLPSAMSQNASEIVLEISSQHSTFVSIMSFMVNDKKSFIRTISHSTDAMIQTELISGWERVCSLSSFIPLFWYPVTLRFWVSFLEKLQHKQLWKLVFQCLTHLITSLQEAIVNAYDIYGTQQFSVTMSSYVATYSATFDDTEESSSPAQVQIILDEMLRSLAETHSFSFGLWYRTFSSYLYKHMFHDIVKRIAFILRETEEPSDETVCLLGKTISEELCVSQLKFQDAAVYRSEIQRCVAACFQLFGSDYMLGLESLSLSKILTTPLTCQSFAYTSNAWLIPFMCQHVKRDNVCFFQKHLLPLTKNLLERVKNRLGSTDAVELIETRHYKRLVEQLWALLPSYFRDPLDGPEFFLNLNFEDNKNLLETMLSQLDVPIIQRHVCTTFSILCKSILSASQKPTTTDSFSSRIWRCESQKFDFSSITKIVKQHATKCMGMLIVRYIQLNKTSFTDKTQAYLTSRASARTAQILLKTLEDVVAVCDSNIVERNLQNLSSAWNDSVVHACSLLVEKNQKEDTTYLKPDSMLLGKECGALVDVVNALIHKVSISSRFDLFKKFLSLLQNCCQGLKTYFETQESKNIVAASNRKILNISEKKTAQEMLSSLLGKAYKGLKHLFEESDTVETASFPQQLVLEAWQIIVLEGRDVSLQTAFKPRITFISVFIRYIRNNFFEFDELAQQKISHELISELLPETLFSLVEPNSVIRQASIDVLKTISQYFDDIQNVFQALLPGFGANSSLMKSATLQAISHLALSFGDRLSLDFIKELLDIVILNLNDKSQPQVFDSTITCLRALQRYVPAEELPDIVYKYSEPLLNSPFASACRLSIRYLLDKALKRAGYSALQQVFPQEHLPLLNYIEKSLRRRIKKKIPRHRQIKNFFVNENSEISFKKAQIEADEQTKKIINDEDEERIAINSGSKIPSLKSLFDNTFDENESSDPDYPFDNKKSKLVPLTHKSKAKRLRSEEPVEFYFVEDHQNANYDLMSKDTNSFFLKKTPASLIKKKKKYTSLNSTNKLSKNKASILLPETKQLPSGSNPFAEETLTINKNNSSSQKLSLDHLKFKRQTLKKKQEQIKRTKKFEHIIRKSYENFRSNKAKGDSLDKKTNSTLQPYSYIKFQPKMAKHPKEATKFFRSTLLFNKQKKLKRKR